jgi:hypothetical protein
MIEEGLVEVRDSVLWPQHLKNAPALKARLLGLRASQIVFLRIDGKIGVWERMRDGSDGRPTTGLKPGDARTRVFWRTLFTNRSGELVRVEAVNDLATSANVPGNHVANKPRRSGFSARTTEPGYTNRNNQTVLRKTATPGNDHNQMVYVLRCNVESCGHEYGVNGSDIFQRLCPRCSGGAPGLSYDH